MSVRIAIVLALLLMVANIVTLGGLGSLLFTLGDGIAIAFFGNALGDIHGDYYLPIAVWIGLAWPVGALLIFYAMLRYQQAQNDSMWLYSLLPVFLLILDVALSLAFHVGAASLSPAFDIQELPTLP